MSVGDEVPAGPGAMMLGSSVLHPTVEGENGAGKTSLVAVAGFQLFKDFKNGRTAQALVPLRKSFQLTPGDKVADVRRRVLLEAAQGMIDHFDDLRARGTDVPDVKDMRRWLTRAIPAPAVNAARNDARAAAAIASCRSSSARALACVAAGSRAASAAARYSSPARTMSSASRADAGTVPTPGHLLAGTGRCWRRFSSLAGRFLGSEFDSTPRLRHFPGQPRHAAKSVRMSEMRLVVPSEGQ